MDYLFFSFFVFGFFLTTILGWFIYKILKYSLTDSCKKDVKKTMYGTDAEVFNKLKSNRKNIQRMGGMIFSIPILISLFLLNISIDLIILKLIFFVYSFGFVVGIYDDLIDLNFIKNRIFNFKRRLLAVFIMGLTVSYSGLSAGLIAYPGLEGFEWLFLLFGGVWFCIWYAGAIIDGVDGLLMSTMILILTGFLVLSIFAINLFLMILILLVLGSLASYYVFYNNSFKTVVYTTECGSMPLTLLIAMISLIFVWNTPIAIISTPLIGMVLFLTWFSNVVQLVYRKFTSKKLFNIAPFHHHLESIGMSSFSINVLYVLTTFIATIISIILFINYG